MLMKNTIATVMLVLLVFPVFLPFAPHAAVHALYESHLAKYGNTTSHHGQSAIHRTYSEHHHHDHESTQHEDHNELKVVGHGLPLDIGSYYSDFLHVELRNVDSDTFDLAINLEQGVDYDMLAAIITQNHIGLSAVKVRAPPDRSTFNQDHSSLYLETLRLRI